MCNVQYPGPLRLLIAHCSLLIGHWRPRQGRFLARTARTHRAFTRVELVVVLAVLALLGLVVVPALANNRPRSERVTCANNLRQIGAAMQLWGNDHHDLFPQEVPVAEGGTRSHPLASNVWLHFAWISNQLGSAKVLFCPSDTGRPARDFTGDPTGGYLHPNFRNRATSYFLSHVGVDGITDLLAGDRNVGSEGPQSCARFGTALRVSSQPVTPRFQWTNSLHIQTGNLLLFDGRVEQLSNRGLRDTVDTIVRFQDYASLHFITPR